MERQEMLRQLDTIMEEIISEWHDRVKESFVTEEDGKLLGVEPEIKRFHEAYDHRIKFSRERELDVTYALAVRERDGVLFLESSVNNKSTGFDYDAFVRRLESYYWDNRHQKPWIDEGFDRFTYEDLLAFEPRMGRSVTLDMRKDKADIIRLSFRLNPQYEGLLSNHPDILKDLIENYCLAPLKRIYAESYRE